MRIFDILPWRRDRRNQLLREEIESHLRMDEAERMARGESPSEATTSARRDFGNVALVHETTRDTWRGLAFERCAQDLRFGARMLRRSPIFAVVTVLCLALGIGANAAVLSWMEGILLRPYPGVAAQDRLVAVAGSEQDTPGYDSMSWPDFRDLSHRTSAFSAFVASKITGATLTGTARADRLVGLLVSANYFDVLGVRPVLGRGFMPNDDVSRGAHPVTVISYRIWQDRFAGDTGVIGKTIGYNGVPHTIVGVAPPEFLGTFVGYAIQFWLPASQQAVVDPSGYKLDDRSARWVEGFARLAPGVTLAQARQDIARAGQRLAADYPNDDRGRGVTVLGLWDAPFDGAKELLPMLRLASVVAALVLIIACANVANLLLVRALSRRHEMTVRLAIGAGRERLLRQLFTESFLLATLGTVTGLGVAYWSRNVLTLLFNPAGAASVAFSADIDWRVVAITAALGLGSTFLFGLVPALQASNIDLAGALKSDARSTVGSSGPRARLRSALVVLQVASSFVLLVGAGLLFSSLRKLRTDSPGFSTDNVVTTALNLFANGYDTARVRRFDGDLLQRVQAIPGVDRAALSRSVPFSRRPYDRGPIAIDGYTPAKNESPVADYDQVTPGYFDVMGIRLRAGRDFTSADEGADLPVAIVSQAFVDKYWPNAEPVGRRVQVGGQWMAVVGVASDLRHRSMLEPPQPIIYVPLYQNFSTIVALVARTSRDVAGVAPGIVRAMHDIDPNVSPYEVLTLREQIDRSTSAQHIALLVVGLFGGLALLLATLGLYGVVSYSVSQSAREVGLRVALGAAPTRVLGFVMTWGVQLTTIGLVLGIVAALAIARLFGTLLYKVSPRDPLTFAVAFAVIGVAGLLACFIPAVRASRIDPMRALRM